MREMKKEKQEVGECRCHVQVRIPLEEDTMWTDVRTRLARRGVYADVDETIIGAYCAEGFAMLMWLRNVRWAKEYTTRWHCRVGR